MTSHLIRSPSIALFIAHPGHELRIYGWLEAAKPITCVLTDGSGQAGRSRLNRTAAILESVGGSKGPVWGRFTDRHIYDAVLRVDCDLFVRIADELGQFLIREEISTIVADAAEGIILSHDLWRGMVNRAVGFAEKKRAIILQNWAFLLDGAATQDLPESTGKTQSFLLDDASLKRKLQMANSYHELRREVQMTITQCGEDSLKTEMLFEVSCNLPRAHWATTPPAYESHGEKQVEAGIYKDVVRYHTHVAPILDALENLEFTPSC